MQLTRSQKIQRKLQNSPKYKGVVDPSLVFVSRYTCSKCGETYYYRAGDDEQPQYKLKGKPLTLCHDCWHTYRPNSSCRICQLREARKKARRQWKIRSKLEASDKPEFATPREVTWNTTSLKQMGVRRRVGLSTRRGGNKDKEKRGSRRRRSSRVS